MMIRQYAATGTQGLIEDDWLTTNMNTTWFKPKEKNTVFNKGVITDRKMLSCLFSPFISKFGLMFTRLFVLARILLTLFS